MRQIFRLVPFHYVGSSARFYKLLLSKDLFCSRFKPSRIIDIATVHNRGEGRDTICVRFGCYVDR
jgi:hypothetical protein